MRWLLTAWLLCAAVACEDDPDDLAYLRDAGGTEAPDAGGGTTMPDAATTPDATILDAATAPDAGADDDGG